MSKYNITLLSEQPKRSRVLLSLKFKSCYPGKCRKPTF